MAVVSGTGNGMLLINVLLCTLLRPARLVESRVGEACGAREVSGIGWVRQVRHVGHVRCLA